MQKMFSWLKRLFKSTEENDYKMLWAKTILGDNLENGDKFYFDENGIIRKAKAMTNNTLKLEDLNKYWIKKDHTGSIFKIEYIDYRSNIIIKTHDYFSYKIDEFLNLFREATQSDIDNLTKG